LLTNVVQMFFFSWSGLNSAYIMHRLYPTELNSQ